MAEVPTYPIVYQAGDSLMGISWQWKGVDGLPKDLTGYTASLKVFSDTDDTTPVVTFALGSGLTLDALNGKVTLSVSPSSLTLLTAGTNYRYTLKVTSSDSSIVKTLTKGPFRVDGLEPPSS